MAKTQARFEDLAFKLAVIEELMFVQEVLKPKYKGSRAEPRQDNKMIPSVKKFFVNLDIPAALLARVEEINQDPNDNVIRMLIPIWDGEGDELTIRSTVDVALVPNLKRATIFVGRAIAEVDDEYVKFGAFAAKGIDVSGWGIAKRSTPGVYAKIERAKRDAKPARTELPVTMNGKASAAKAEEGDAPVFAYIATLPQPQRDIAERIDALAAKTLPNLQRAVKNAARDRS